MKGCLKLKIAWLIQMFFNQKKKCVMKIAGLDSAQLFKNSPEAPAEDCRPSSLYKASVKDCRPSSSVSITTLCVPFKIFILESIIL